jgi:general secretion pathway protein H
MISHSKNHAAAGFTLMEMLIVIAIAGLVMVLVSVRGTPVSPATHARAAARSISGALRSARAEALMENRPVELSIDLARHSYQRSGAPAQTLGEDVTLELLTSRDENVSGTVGSIRFNPDGSSSGGRVSVTGGGKTWWVGIDWLSGRVSIAEKQS